MYLEDIGVCWTLMYDSDMPQHLKHKTCDVKIPSYVIAIEIIGIRANTVEIKPKGPNNITS